jgi:aminoglycoside phosphotransferase (APT) family kinase protein
VSASEHDHSRPAPPATGGVRPPWEAVPARVRLAVERWLGAPVVEAVSQLGGFSPGAAARLRTADGRRAFVKAIGPAPNPDSPALHRREARIAAALPPTVAAPPLLWSYDEGEIGWVALLFADIDGREPAQPWRADELDRVLVALDALGAALTPSPLPVDVAGTASEAFARHVRGWELLRDQQPAALAALDPWAAAHLDALIALEQRSPAAAAGDTLLHFDLRADNILLTDKQVWVVDWPHARNGAAWVDAVLLAPSVAMQGGPSPEQLLARRAAAGADADAVTAVVAALAGYFTQRGLQPPPPGLPTLRAFQAAQGAVARAWLARRLASAG